MATKYALCIKKDTELDKVFHKDSEFINVYMVDREICEDPKNDYLQIIPYVVFYTVDTQNNKIKFLNYTRPSNNSEERLINKVSVGLGGHIDHTDIEIPQEGKTINNNTLNEIIIKAAIREIKEEIGIDLKEEVEEGNMTSSNSYAFNIEGGSEVDSVHVCNLLPIYVKPDYFDEFLSKLKLNEAEIEKAGTLALNLDGVVEDYDISATCDNLIKELNSKYNMENWSLFSVAIIVKSVYHYFMSKITFEDIKQIAMQKIQEQATQEEAQTQVH